MGDLPPPWLEAGTCPFEFDCSSEVQAGIGHFVAEEMGARICHRSSSA